ncbi:MAG TPA: DUF1844 domain-containing protein [Blastocatellia bacterium]|nr:DUF1844 domain-containing protein [Blastocatellia bacterium]
MPDKDDDVSFKVRDKRLFNPDGSLRESTEEEEVVEPKKESTAAASAQTATQSAGAHLEPERPSTTESTQPTQQSHDHETAPLEFINFIYGLASNAFANLGMMPHPVTGEATVDLETAKHFIDIIGLLEKKTQGNLSAQESKMIAEILRDLRMQYVSLINTQK